MSNVRISEATFPTSVAIATTESLFNRLSSDYLLDLDDYPLGWVTKIFECSDSIFFLLLSCVSISGPTSLRARLCVQISILFFLQHALNHSPKETFFEMCQSKPSNTQKIYTKSHHLRHERTIKPRNREMCVVGASSLGNITYSARLLLLLLLFSVLCVILGYMFFYMSRNCCREIR